MDPTPHLGRMRKWAWRFAQYDAEDLVQDTCLDALRLKYDPSRGASEITVLYRILRNRYLRTLDLLHAQKRALLALPIQEVKEAMLPAMLPRQENVTYVCEVVSMARKLTKSEQRALAAAITGDPGNRTWLWRARKALGREPWETMRRA